MKNIYAAKDPVGPKLPKNTFDLTHRENMSFDFGKIYPCGQPIEVVPGDSVEFSINAAIHAMPLDFPVQTDMMMSVYAFYVRNRILWDNWENYITGVYDETPRKKPEHPWIRILTRESFDKKLKTKSLGDYLGLPTTLVGDFANTYTIGYSSNTLEVTAEAFTGSVDDGLPGQITAAIGTVGTLNRQSIFRRPLMFRRPSQLASWNDLNSNHQPFTLNDMAQAALLTGNLNLDDYCSGLRPNLVGNIIDPSHAIYGCKILAGDVFCYWTNSRVDSSWKTVHYSLETADTSTSGSWYCIWFASHPGMPDAHSVITGKQYSWWDNDSNRLCLKIDDDSYINQYLSMGYHVFPFWINWLHSGAIYDQNFFIPPLSFQSSSSIVELHPGVRCMFDVQQTRPQDARFDDSPYVGAAPKERLSALPFRAYNMICNSYFRNDKIDPILDSNLDPVYNEFCESTGDGADDFDYDFRHCNYELDQFTDAVPSPQFGPAPLIGVQIKDNHTATLHFDASNIVGSSPQQSGGTLTADVTFTDDGNMQVTGITRYDDDLPSGDLRRLMDKINMGISINDIRNVNAYQRFKERMQLRSYRYKDQILNHFSQRVDNVDVDMPEYIGGANFHIMVNKVNNTAAPGDAGGAPLGDYAGQASIKDGSRVIRCHCPEHGMIMVVACVRPRPCYTQAVPKIFTKTVTKFDYFFPEFGKIGNVPIKNFELAPLQFAKYDIDNGTDTLHDTFGYQRAWYEYIQMMDGAHGCFRIELANYLAMRLFNQLPALSPRFIEVHDDDVNNIFSIRKYDHFLGYIDYVGSIRHAIPRKGMPSLS